MVTIILLGLLIGTVVGLLTVVIQRASTLHRQTFKFKHFSSDVHDGRYKPETDQDILSKGYSKKDSNQMWKD